MRTKSLIRRLNHELKGVTDEQLALAEPRGDVSSLGQCLPLGELPVELRNLHYLIQSRSQRSAEITAKLILCSVKDELALFQEQKKINKEIRLLGEMFSIDLADTFPKEQDGQQFGSLAVGPGWQVYGVPQDMARFSFEDFGLPSGMMAAIFGRRCEASEERHQTH
ncbi:MAG: hypothetical protein AAB615_02350 [Patescibacteria group bacterium]